MGEGRREEAILTAHAEAVTPRAGALPGPVEALYREHHARVFRAAYRVTGSVSDAEDGSSPCSS